MAEVPPVAAIKGASKARKPSGPSATELLTQAVSASKERSGVSLAALKKSLAASGYDVEKNNSRIKLGLKSLVSKGTLVQTKGTGASGSFKLNKKQAEARDKAAKKKAPLPPAAPKGRKPGAAAKGAKKPVKKAAAGAAKKVAKSPKKVAKSPKKAKITKTTKSPAKRPLKPKAKSKPKTSKAKVVSRKK